MTDYRFEGLGKEWATIEAEEIAALHERAKKAERERDEFASKAVRLEHAWSAANSDLIATLEELAEAREDIKALATVAGGDPWPHRSEHDAAWQRIRDRKLLEVSDAE